MHEKLVFGGYYTLKLMDLPLYPYLLILNYSRFLLKKSKFSLSKKHQRNHPVSINAKLSQKLVFVTNIYIQRIIVKNLLKVGLILRREFICNFSSVQVQIYLKTNSLIDIIREFSTNFENNWLIFLFNALSYPVPEL